MGGIRPPPTSRATSLLALGPIRGLPWRVAPCPRIVRTLTGVARTEIGIGQSSGRKRSDNARCEQNRQSFTDTHTSLPSLGSLPPAPLQASERPVWLQPTRGIAYSESPAAC